MNDFNRNRGRRNFGDNRDSGRRTMFPATCSECGNKCEIPFEPREGRPVYCRNCFEKRGESSSNSRRFERTIPFNNSNNNRNNNNLEIKEKLDQINSKIDKLLDLLGPTVKSEIVKKVD